MSVPKSQRSKPKLEVHVRLRRLVAHTLTKTRNGHKFGSCATYVIARDERGLVASIEEHRTSSRKALAERIEESALLAGECAWRANDVRVASRADYELRHGLQQESIRHLDALSWLVECTRECCGLSGREVAYWSDLVREARGLVRKWRDADARRYRDVG